MKAWETFLSVVPCNRSVTSDYNQQHLFYYKMELQIQYKTKSSSAAGRTRRQLGNTSTCSYGRFRDDYVICRNGPYRQVLVLPSRRLVCPAAENDLV